MAGTPIVHKDLHVEHAIVGKFNAASDATGKKVMTLPKDAIVTKVITYVGTGFNGTSPTLKLGSAGTTNALADTTDTAAATAGIKESAAATLTSGGFNNLVSADTDIIVTLGGTSVTTGIAYFVVKYVYPFEIL